jgi:hypothetical protein
MMKLSAEREIALVRKIASRWRDDLPKGKGGGSRKILASIVAQQGNTDRLCELAKAGDKDAAAGLCMAASSLIKRGKPLPEGMAKYVADILLWRGLEGGHNRSNANQHRDYVILLLVQKFTNEGWLPTRNRESQGAESACSIIQKGLALAGENLSESRVEDIWREQTKWWES